MRIREIIRTLPLLLALGCGSGPLSEVRGTLKLNNVPVPNAEVVFLPDKGTTGPRSSALTDADGRFTLKTDDGRLGAVVGKHRVTVRTSRPRALRGRDGDTPAEQPAERAAYTPISEIYGKPDDSNPLGHVEVTTDRHTYDLNLK